MEIYPKVILIIILMGKILCGSYFIFGGTTYARVRIDARGRIVLKVLVETRFMLALNPRDKHHEWIMKVLKEARRREILLHISPVAPVELFLIMKTRDYGT